MRIPGHTPLGDFPDLPPSTRQALAGMWVESVEELVALIAAVEGQVDAAPPDEVLPAFQAGPGLAAGRLGAERLQGLKAARPGGALGCCLKPDVLERYAAYGMVNPPRERPPMAFGAAVPGAVRLMDRLPPVKDQGERGTCVAFGSVALREFLGGRKPLLSEQFLYWACKELDGIPEAEGTYVHTAMSALAEYGVCEEKTWPYRPRPVRGNEGQGPPPAPALAEAKTFRMGAARTVEPSLVEHYKQVLAGDEQAPGMPVVFATLVFNSWFRSPETHRTGKLTMPLPRERPAGGHAWCVVGYADDAGVPGGGYLIVRNSWGQGWAAESPEAPGHALMPYAYVERYAVEAFSGPSDKVAGAGAEAAAEGDPFERHYVATLDAPARDLEGRKWPAGTRVIRHPYKPSLFKEDASKNREEFERLDFAWDDETRARNKEVWAEAEQRKWFPPLAEMAPDWREARARAQGACARFMSALDSNLKEARGHTFPQVNLPWWHGFLLWEPRIRPVEEFDLASHAPCAWRATAGVPEAVAWPEEWLKEAGLANALRVYRCRALGAAVDVVVGFLSPLRFADGRAPEPKASGREEFEALRAAHAAWLRFRKFSPPRFTFYSLGVASGWDAGMEAVADGSHWVVLASPRDGKSWETRVPPRPADRLALRNFLARLKPETRAERVSKIRAFVDEELAANPDATLHWEKVKKGTGYRESEVLEAFRELAKLGHYEVYQDAAKGRVSIRRVRAGEGIAAKLKEGMPVWVRSLLVMWLSVVVGGLITYTLPKVLPKVGTMGNIWFITPLCMIIANLINKWLQKRLENKD